MDPATTTGGVDAITGLKKQRALKALGVEKLSTDCDGHAQQIKELQAEFDKMVSVPGDVKEARAAIDNFSKLIHDQVDKAWNDGKEASAYLTVLTKKFNEEKLAGTDDVDPLPVADLPPALLEEYLQKLKDNKKKTDVPKEDTNRS
ncbi:hypothetical protein GTA08_BOTSDO13536 [Botryosphaeria dothidea]|uniref:Uncharacterized protein n=1 Tax=Botryosphaeria dothidea TaxID=55169 RepID=A0A8H4N4N3_9PEZI|nr:hypothetical protein GTA08_BOTSDO13536 [Botryosphaeria dothidea]